MLAWYIFLYLFIFNLFVPLSLKGVSFGQHIVGSYSSKIQSENLCFLNGVFNPFTLNVTVDMVVYSCHFICFLYAPCLSCSSVPLLLTSMLNRYFIVNNFNYFVSFFFLLHYFELYL